MIRKLFRQMCREWRSNLWLLTELVVVSVVLWYIASDLSQRYKTYATPNNFDTEHCYEINVNVMPHESPDYQEDAPGPGLQYLDLLERLQRMPEVEYASLGMVSRPYNGSNSYMSLSYDTLWCKGLRRLVTPDFPQVFQYQGYNGENAATLSQALKDGQLVASSSLNFGGKVPITDLIGETVYWEGDTVEGGLDVKYLTQPVKYHDYSLWTQYAMLDITEPLLEGGFDETINLEVSARIRPEYDVAGFKEAFREKCSRELRTGNLYVSGVCDYPTIRHNFQLTFTQDMRNMAIGMGFLMFNVFLALLGTFWVRTRERTSEIAIRKVNGATRGNIFSSFELEGVILLVVATCVAILFDFLLTHWGLSNFYDQYSDVTDWSRFWICVAITFVAMLLMILIGIAIPAYRAMRIAPALALHDE